MNKYNYIIYHRGCYDGFSAFIVLCQSGLMDKDAIILPDVPSSKFTPKNIAGKDVIIMDTAYNYDILRNIFELANSVTFIDHHITIRNDVEKLKKEFSNKNINIIYEESECGATLTWKFLFPNKKIPWFLKYIKANDTGKWETYNNTYNFMAYLNVYYKTELTDKNIKHWYNLFNRDEVKHGIKKGKIYKEYIDYMLEQNTHKYSMMLFPSETIYEKYTDKFKSPGQYKVAVSSSPCPNSSQLGNKMMNEINCDFVIFFTQNLDRKEYVLSFRSLNVDVGEITKIFGGGGHKLAAACSISMHEYSIDELFLKDALPRQKK